MIIYITGTENQKMIENAIYEIQMENTLSIGEPIKSNSVNLLAEVKSTLCKNKDISTLILDLSVIENEDDEIIKSIQTLRFYNDECRFIIIALEREIGDSLLSELVNMGIYNIITDVDDTMSKITYFTLNNATYKEASIFQIKEIEDDTKKNKRKSKTEKLTQKAKKEKTKIILQPLKQKVVISVVGSQKRVGTTHTCITLAYTLVKKGNRVAVVGFNDNSTLDSLAECYESEYMTNEVSRYLKLYQIDFYSNVSKDLLSLIEGLKYDYIILDNGYIIDCDLSEHNRADVRLVVFGSRAWEQQYLGQAFNFVGDEIASRYRYLTLCDEKMKKEIIEEMNPIKVFFPKYHHEPFSEDEELLKALEGFLYESEMPKKKKILSMFSL